MTRQQATGYETSGPFGPFWGGLALASLPLLERSGRSDGTGSREPVGETGGPGPGTLPADGAVRPVGRD